VALVVGDRGLTPLAGRRTPDIHARHVVGLLILYSQLDRMNSS